MAHPVIDASQCSRSRGEIVKVKMVAFVGAVIAMLPSGCSSSIGAGGQIDCTQINGFFRCAGNYPSSCLETLGWASDMAVPYRAGFYPIGVNGELGEVMAEVDSECGSDGLQALVNEFPDIPDLVAVYG